MSHTAGCNASFTGRANGARIWNLREISCRNPVSDLMLGHTNPISQAGEGSHFRKSFRCHLEFARRGVGGGEVEGLGTPPYVKNKRQ
jgi:hypothetical protein